jgi:TFIIF-interacting CTD phosphatase-like protein
MAHDDPKLEPTLPRRATIVHNDPTKVKSSFKQLHHMDQCADLEFRRIHDDPR